MDIGNFCQANTVSWHHYSVNGGFAMSRGTSGYTINRTKQIKGDETYLYQPQAPMQQLYQNQMM